MQVVDFINMKHSYRQIKIGSNLGNELFSARLYTENFYAKK